LPDLNTVAILVGRIMVAAFFLMNGINHFAKAEMMAGYAKSQGTPAPKLAVIGTGVLLVLGGLSILLGYHPGLGALLLIIFLAGVSVQMHAFWRVSDPMAKMNDMIHFLKNVAMIGLLLMTLGIQRPWPFSLGR
jgi:putative oxidoreductase